ncbi:Hypothetical predicted protein [Marmota monax]|uniref:MAGE domain-containing protein n=1 Tax=Marmota monax TaxID=9995 RepID=A0A5E4CKJ7_MARMO|nr:hypothetical protein GHT09_012571 [Marmota monax]VTJ82383.1 Hypothetical predicted protein [Marmota monax]
MPSGQKSKVKAREKHHQTPKESKDLVHDQATVAKEDDYAYSSSVHFKGIPHGCLAETLYNPQDPGRIPSTTITTAAILFTRSVESINNNIEERGPITKAEIPKNDIQIHKNHFSEILKRVSELLELVFGLELKLRHILDLLIHFSSYYFNITTYKDPVAKYQSRLNEGRIPVSLPTARSKTIMPRGQKSKLHAREKRHQAQTQEQPLDLWEQPSGGKAKLFSSPACHWAPGRLDEKVVILVYYLLYKYQMKEPITKAEMLRNIIQMHKSHFLEILRKASEHLELVFGLDIKEMDSNKHIYILINKLELSYDARLGDDGGVPKTGLLMTILGVIFTKGNRATEEQVWQILNAMGLYSGREHFIFGEPRKLITKDLVKKKYLEYQQVPNSDPPRYEFLWGPRAYAETSKMKVLEFLAKVHDTIPSAYQTWYEEALRDEEARAQARAAARAHISAIVIARSRALSSYSSRPK